MSAETQDGTPDYTGMESYLLLYALGDDAGLWAKAFCQHVKKLEGHDLDEGWVLGWFANAIEHSTDVRRWRSQPQTSPVIDPNIFPTPREKLKGEKG